MTQLTKIWFVCIFYVPWICFGQEIEQHVIVSTDSTQLKALLLHPNSMLSTQPRRRLALRQKRLQRLRRGVVRGMQGKDRHDSGRKR
jgi:hypothetical protein